jgi:hypothetical protein
VTALAGVCMQQKECAAENYTLWDVHNVVRHCMVSWQVG